MPSHKTVNPALRLVVALVMLTFGMSPLAFADGLSSTATVSGGASNTFLCQSSSADAGVVSACEGSWTFAMTEFGAANASAVAGYGILGAFASASMTTSEQGGNVGSVGVGQASFADSLSFLGLTQPAFLATTISLEGSSSLSGTASSVQVQYYIEFNNGAITDCILTQVGTCTAMTAIDPNGTVSFFGAIDAEALASTFFGTGTAKVDYINTGMVDSLNVVDAAGNVIKGASIISTSGTDYNSLTETVPTPEPGSLMLLGFGVAGLILVSRRGASSSGA
jgi:PEP-CTERM motif